MRPQYPWSLLFAFLCCFAAWTTSHAASITLNPVADTTLFEPNPDNNLGGNQTGAIGATAEGKAARMLFRFDIAGSLPAGAKITGGTLELTVTRFHVEDSITVQFHRMLRSWGEGTGGTGDSTGPGGQAFAGEATWKVRAGPGTAWSAPGAAAPADFAPDITASTAIGSTDIYTVASTPLLVADLQAWLDNPSTNFGWIAISTAESATGTAKRVGTRENPDGAPVLTLTYETGPVATKPTITGHPQAVTVIAGNSASFSVAHDGTAPFTYQWRRNGDPIPTATDPTYTIPAASPADEGTYTVFVQNAAGSATSDPAQLTVLIPPAIPVSPTAQTVIAGNSVSFSVSPTGTAPFTFQWRRNGDPIPTGTGPTYTIPSASPADEGTYTVFIQNAAGSATSDPAQLTVLVPPSIPVSPQAQTVIAGNTVSFTVAPTGTAPFTYQWRRNGDPIPTGTGPTYTIPSASPADEGTYTVFIQNAAGSATSDPAQLTVLVPPSIPVSPQAQTVIAGNTFSFTVAPTGTAPFTYQWRRNGDPIPTGTGPTYTIPSASPADEGTYTVFIQNAAGSATSDPAQLTVLPAPLAVSLAPVADTAIFEVNPDRNFGTSAALRAGSTAQGKRARALLRFDLQGVLPADAVITNAVLSLSVVKAPGGGGAPSVFGLHRMGASWVEGSHDDADAVGGEVTWNRRAAPDTSWAAPGGSAGVEFEALPSATASVAGINRYTFGPGLPLVSDLQFWVANPDSNFGWMLMTESEGTPQTAREFASREGAAGQPELRIEYTRIEQDEAPRFESFTSDSDQLTLRIKKGASLVVVLESSASPGGAVWKGVANFDAGAAPESLAYKALINTDSTGTGFYRLRVTGRKP